MTPKSGSLPDPDEFKRTLLERFEEKKKLIVGISILAVILIIGFVFYTSLGRQAANEDWYKLYDASRFSLNRAPQLNELTQQGNHVFQAHALLQYAEASILERNYEDAAKALDRLIADYGDTALANLPSPDRRKPLPELLRDRMKADAEWEKKYGYDEAPKVGNDRVALVETDMGGFWVGFYDEYSPKHVENFIAKAKAGAFNGTRFYQVSPTQTRFGGATTMDDDETNDATEVEGATYLEPERGRYRIEHARGMLSSVTSDAGESADKVTIAFHSAPDLNKRQTIFGRVLLERGAGMQALDEIRNVKTYATSEDPFHRQEQFLDLADHPIKPVKVIRISIWSGDKLEDGHAWDTTAVDPKAGDEKPKKEEKPSEETDEPAEEEKPADAPEEKPEGE